ncbi:hypothetical protein, partial [Moorena sp. SIO4G3]|uniref:hypothetical protein n=1 Tax=Moorena sp. SIO4G3 TaxID=2607821 RepID=UPI0025E98210
NQKQEKQGHSERREYLGAVCGESRTYGSEREVPWVIPGIDSTYTIDVSDIMPVTLGQPRLWDVAY